jgi:hypothetical protein
MDSFTEYELKLQRAFIDTCKTHGSPQIKDKESWDYFNAIILRYKLMSIKDQERLTHFTPCFPCSFETILQTITQVFADKNL